jgi:hypothetical protein
MTPRRNVYDPLEPTTEPRWYEVRDMHNRLLESRLLSPGSNLKRAFVVAMLEHIDAGWQLGEFGSRVGVFFCTRGTERRMVSVTPTAPGTEHRRRCDGVAAPIPGLTKRWHAAWMRRSSTGLRS